MSKIDTDYIVNQFRSGIESYLTFTKEVGLWKSEKYTFDKYLKKTNKILDLGCGAGRVTFALYKLGYKNIIGIDLTPEMIETAGELQKYFNTQIKFEIGNATELDFLNDTFDSVIFSFNGLMCIPNHFNRNKVMKEVNRVLKENGLFLFTTHDRYKEPQFLQFWEDEKTKWSNGKQDLRLHEFGDLITKSKHGEGEIFVHVPSETEIIHLLNASGFEIIETFYRSDKFDEAPNVKSKATECRFWITKKGNAVSSAIS